VMAHPLQVTNRNDLHRWALPFSTRRTRGIEQTMEQRRIDAEQEYERAKSALAVVNQSIRSAELPGLSSTTSSTAITPSPAPTADRITVAKALNKRRHAKPPRSPGSAQATNNDTH